MVIDIPIGYPLLPDTRLAKVYITMPDTAA
jgi:hypothetical protein